MWNVKHFVDLRYLKRISIFDTTFLISKSRAFYSTSSQRFCSAALYSMDEDAAPLTSGSSNKTTYAGVLSKGRVPTDDISNNNPNSETEIINENQTPPISTVNSSIQPSAISEENKNSLTSNTPDSMSDSFEDAEEDQTNFNTLSTADSNLTNGTKSKEETQSSLVTEISSNDMNVQSSSSTAEGSESEVESDVEEEQQQRTDGLYPTALKWKLRSSKPITDLPDTVTLLETKHGSKVYVVGTAHFSVESQEDVAKTIKAVQPDIVVIELCKSRLNILSLDETAILEEAKTLNLHKIRQTIAENGFLQGVLYLLLISMSAHLTKQLGMAPGGEFRRAYQEARQIPGCLIHLGDRPIHVTLQRALAKLSLWQKIRIGWHMLRSKDPISKEEVERCKQKDLLEEMLAEMTGAFPELSQVFVRERDLYLTYSLQTAASPMISAQCPEVPAPSYVVGVVGIGHIPGIQEHWGKVTEEDIPPVLHIPEPSKSSIFIRYTVRYSLYGLGLYGIYKVFPRSLLSTKLFSALKQPFVR